MADESTPITEVKVEEYITDKHLKKYMVVISHLIISGAMFMYAYKMYSSATVDFLAKFDGMVLLWYAIATLALTFPTIAIEIIRALKSK